MFKLKSFFLFILVGAMIFLTGCESSGDLTGTISEKAEISEIRSGFTESVERLRNKSYDNLVFTKTAFSFPDELESVSELKATPLKGKSVDEIYEYLCDAIDFLTDKEYTDEEKRHDIRFVDADYDDKNERYPYSSPNIDEYKNGYETEYPWPTVGNDDYSLDLMFGVLRSFDDGSLVEYDGVSSGIRQMYFMISTAKHPVVFYTEDLTCTDKYKLIDGEISIADAAAFAQNYLDSLDFTPYEGNIPKSKIVAVNVVNIGNGNYGYNFVVAYTYKGLCFNFDDRKETDSGGLFVDTDYDERDYSGASGSIDMIRTDKVCRFFDVANGVDITEGEPQTSVITLETAADKISEFFSGFMTFYVDSVSVVWLSEKKSGEMTMPTYPCWKFKMYANGDIYHTFVNMITGEVYLYIQVPN